jgi:hypothetical protein
LTEQETLVEGALGWDANFKLDWDILEYSVKDTDGIKGVVRTNELGSTFLTGFSLSIRPSSAEEALAIAVEKGNRVADYLGSIHNLPVRAFLLSITEIKPEGEVKTGITPLISSANLHKPVDLDFANIKSLLTCENPKVLRLLAHFNFGLKCSSDSINQFREFYLIMEDTYGKKHPYLRKYSYIRHALNHPELDIDKFAQKLLCEIGASHLDPSSSDAQNLVKKNLHSLKNDARQIIENLMETI